MRKKYIGIEGILLIKYVGFHTFRINYIDLWYLFVPITHDICRHVDIIIAAQYIGNTVQNLKKICEVNWKYLCLFMQI